MYDPNTVEQVLGSERPAGQLAGALVINRQTLY